MCVEFTAITPLFLDVYAHLDHLSVHDGRSNKPLQSRWSPDNTCTSPGDTFMDIVKHLVFIHVFQLSGFTNTFFCRDIFDCFVWFFDMVTSAHTCICTIAHDKHCPCNCVCDQDGAVSRVSLLQRRYRYLDS